MDVKLRQLRYFKAVVDHGTIAAAAGVLHIAQPPLSKQIRQLEADAGVSLFERINHRLQLRDEGRYLYKLAAELLSMADDLDEKMRALSSGIAGTLRIGTTAPGQEPIARAVARLGTLHPSLHFAYWQAIPPMLQRMVDERRIDVALLPTPIEVPGLIFESLAPLRYVALSATNASMPAHLDMEALAKQPLVLLHRDSRLGNHEQVLNAFHARGLNPHVVAECAGIPILMSLVRHGVGIGLIVINANEPMDDLSPGLTTHEVSGMPDVDGELVVVRKGNVEPSPALRLFLDHLHDRLPA